MTFSMIKVFIDFDGTITRQDVGDTMFETFGGKKCLKFIQDYREGKLSALDCFRKECLSCGEVNKKELDGFIDSQEIDRSFKIFLNFCNDQELSYHIVSDGMDYYIQRILERNCLSDVPYFTNHLDLEPLDGTTRVLFKPSFPFTDEVCDRCAFCKRNHILTLCNDDDIIVYIGEGYSDHCPVRYADIVFAKDDLQKYCHQENISYFEYRTFADIIERMTNILERQQSKKNSLLRKRRQAQLAAREAFIGG
jgi:2,3-diketo-5-methylthio-1-phosphopentane phosphatase